MNVCIHRTLKHCQKNSQKWITMTKQIMPYNIIDPVLNPPWLKSNSEDIYNVANLSILNVYSSKNPDFYFFNIDNKKRFLSYKSAY